MRKRMGITTRIGVRFVVTDAPDGTCWVSTAPADHPHGHGLLGLALKGQSTPAKCKEIADYLNARIDEIYYCEA